MKVWHLCSNRWNSAITEYALRSAQSLALQGGEQLVSALAGRPLDQRASELGLTVDRWPDFKPGFASVRRLRQTAKAFQPEVIICYGGPETSLLQLLPKGPALWRFRGQNEDALRQRAGRLFQFSHRHLHGMLTPSSILADRLRQQWLASKPVTAVALGLASQHWNFQADAYAKAERPTLRIVGRFDPIKGHGPFFLWFRMLLDVWPQGEPQPWLEVIGEPANIPTAHLHAFARDVGLRHGQDYDIVDQRLSDLDARMSATHLGVICSQGSEVICRVAEEFLLCGCPLFVSGVGSLEDCLQHDGFGVSYRQMEPTVAVATLKQWLWQSWREDAALRAARAEAAKQAFSLETMGKALVAALQGQSG